MIRQDGKIKTIKVIVTSPEYLSSTIFGIMIDMTEHYTILDLENKNQEMLLKMKHKSQFVAEIIHEISMNFLRIFYFCRSSSIIYYENFFKNFHIIIRKQYKIFHNFFIFFHYIKKFSLIFNF